MHSQLVDQVTVKRSLEGVMQAETKADAIPGGRAHVCTGGDTRKSVLCINICAVVNTLRRGGGGGRCAGRADARMHHARWRCH